MDVRSVAKDRLSLNGPMEPRGAGRGASPADPGLPNRVMQVPVRCPQGTSQRLSQCQVEAVVGSRTLQAQGPVKSCSNLVCVWRYQLYPQQLCQTQGMSPFLWGKLAQAHDLTQGRGHFVDPQCWRICWTFCMISLHKPWGLSPGVLTKVLS